MLSFVIHCSDALFQGQKTEINYVNTFCLFLLLTFFSGDCLIGYPGHVTNLPNLQGLTCLMGKRIYEEISDKLHENVMRYHLQQLRELFVLNLLLPLLKAVILNFLLFFKLNFEFGCCLRDLPIYSKLISYSISLSIFRRKFRKNLLKLRHLQAIFDRVL